MHLTFKRKKNDKLRKWTCKNITRQVITLARPLIRLLNHGENMGAAILFTGVTYLANWLY